MRLFIAIDFPKEIIEEIVKIQKNLPHFIGKKTEKENLHLTLKFLGEVDEEEVNKIGEFLKKVDFPIFEAELGEIGVFSEEFIRIVWMSIKGCDELQKQIDSSLSDLFSKEKRFMGHLTIARVKNIDDKFGFLEKLNKIFPPKLKFRVNKFKLIKSELTKKGPVYSILREYSLKK